MSDLNDRVNQLADYSWLKLIARISLPVIAFVGASAWNDLKEQGLQLQQVLQNQAVAEEKINGAMRRLDNLEDWQRKITYQNRNN